MGQRVRYDAHTLLRRGEMALVVARCSVPEFVRIKLSYCSLFADDERGAVI
jgi:hypothetical protein